MPPLSPKEEKTEPTDPVQPIHLDDAQYCLLTRALRPAVVPVRKDIAADVPKALQPAPANPAAVAPEQPPDTPII